MVQPAAVRDSVHLLAAGFAAVDEDDEAWPRRRPERAPLALTREHGAVHDAKPPPKSRAVKWRSTCTLRGYQRAPHVFTRTVPGTAGSARDCSIGRSRPPRAHRQPTAATIFTACSPTISPRCLPGTGCYAALLTPQGRMISDMRVSELGDRVLIDLPARDGRDRAAAPRGFHLQRGRRGR